MNLVERGQSKPRPDCDAVEGRGTKLPSDLYDTAQPAPDLHKYLSPEVSTDSRRRTGVVR